MEKLKEDTFVISCEVLKKKTARILEMAGMTEADALKVAKVLVSANARGVESHGVILIPSYVKWLMNGRLKSKPEMKFIKNKGSIMVMDADSGEGHLTMTNCMETAIVRAKEVGVCVLAVRNAMHFGAAGYYANMAAKQGIASIVMCNSSPLMAPWGGTEKMLGSNPLAIGFPAEDYPIIVDMATSGMAYGKIRVFNEKGLKLPAGMALDKDGNPTIDPAEALKGVLLPAAGPKGYGLAVAIDLFSGVISGAPCGYEIVSWSKGNKGEINCGHFAILLNVEDFVEDMDEYYSVIRKTKETYHSCKPMKGVDRIYVPGEIEYEKELAAEKDGIMLQQYYINMLDNLEKELSSGEFSTTNNAI